MNVTVGVENLGRSGEGAFQMVVFSVIAIDGRARKRRNWNGVRNPFIENDLKGNWRRSKMTVELNFKEVTLHQSINGDTLIFRQLITLGCNCQRNLTLLEVEINRSEDCNNSHSWVRRIKGAVGGWSITVEIAFGHTIQTDDWSRNVRSDLHHNFSISKNICFWQIIL
jgi:hypothetical protein